METTTVGDFPLSTVLLQKDAAVPWIILVPKLEGIRELYQAPMESQQGFLLESQYVCKAMETLYKPDKINLGELGNLVPQLHIHVVARYISDEAWPASIWGNTTGTIRSEADQNKMMEALRDELSKDRSFRFVAA